ncbi:hypothetical protein CDD81_7572 [Ophiocordyceps australis]|uniref:Uncharacterized protein n=1 Tax=Ophiocordyceps australis TaxID=1399860 RepID=A0A2C5X8Z0_9HYPO|nr:hypothetical protein CDD81_7572 [Ophiocordyceps australis]
MLMAPCDNSKDSAQLPAAAEANANEHADRPSREDWTPSQPGIRNTVSIHESDDQWLDAMSVMETGSAQGREQSPRIPRVAFMSGSLPHRRA